MESAVKVSRGTVVGIGKVKILRTTEFNYEIPMASFIVIEEAENSFISSCITFCLDGYGKAEDLAVENMIKHINSFLKTNFTQMNKEDAWYNLKDLACIDEDNTELWNAYRHVQYDLAAAGIPTDSADALKKRIAQLKRRIEQLESENAQLKEEFWQPPIVDYTPIRKLRWHIGRHQL